jgi:Zn finger protein HypA/HybF involved in hydrogenase expression
LFWKM